jgi:hypothetical protein
MANIYCSSCGTKHMIGSKFCSNCGSSLVVQILAKSNRAIIQPNRGPELDEDGLPTTFVRPNRLDYEIQKEGRNKFSVNEIISQKPSSEKFDRPSSISRSLSREEYLAQSLKECQSSRNFEDVNEP